MKNNANDYVIRVLDSPLKVESEQWNALLALQALDGSLNPFMRHEYLAALHESKSAVPTTGWTPRFVTLWQGAQLAGACALYLKEHSYGEYVFDHAWANAYQQHGLEYYPKALVAVPFTPVPGARLLARSASERLLLIKGLVAWCEEQKLSSLHLLFADNEDVVACEQAGLMLRHTVQFHWTNKAPTLGTGVSSLPPEGVDFPRGGPSGNLAPTLATGVSSLPPEGVDSPWGGPSGNLAPTLGTGVSSLPPEGVPDLCAARPFRDFDDFLMSLTQDKRKKIRQERRKVADAGIRFRSSRGKDISTSDWDFFYKCYAQTYYEHGNAPYLSRDFFQRMQDTMPENWLLFVAEYTPDNGQAQAVATSLIAITAGPRGCAGTHGSEAGIQAVHGASATQPVLTAYGRYWGALARVDCLHFEACYYQPLIWCIEQGFARFEGGAQGEHKMARALLPVKTTSAHWLAHPAFADAVERFLDREGAGIASYMEDLERRSPFKSVGDTG